MSLVLGASFELRLIQEGYELDETTHKYSHGITLALPKFILENHRIDTHTLSMLRLSAAASHLASSQKLYHLDTKHYFAVLQGLESIRYPIACTVSPNILQHILSMTQKMQEVKLHVTPEQVSSRLGAVWDALSPYQQVGVLKGIKLQKFYLADEMGAGKTLQALAVAKYFCQSNLKTLIVCPAILKNTWKREILKWIEEDEDQTSILSKPEHVLDQNRPFRYNIISYPLATKYQNELSNQYDILILDEAHYLKHSSSKRTQALLKIGRRTPIKMLLSGTPCSYPAELYSQIKILYPEIYPCFFDQKNRSEHHFADRYCNPVQVGTRFGAPQWQFKGYEKPKELNAVLETFIVRRTKEEILTHLPPKQRVRICLDPLSQEQVMELQKTMETSNNGYEYMASFRLTSQFKTQSVLNYLQHIFVPEMRTTPTKQALIFVHHKALCLEIEHCLQEEKCTFFVLDGSTNDKKRAEYEKDFQTSDKYQIGVLSIQAACAGLTLTRATIVVFTEILFGPDIMLQAEDRVHRVGQKHPVQIRYLVQPQSTDDTNLGLIKKKKPRVLLFCTAKEESLLGEALARETQKKNLKSN